MEVAGDVRAALAWAIMRREAFMSRTNEPLDMRVITNLIRGEFVDLRGLPSDIDETARWDIGRRYYDQSAAGILFRHPTILGADFLSVFDPAALVSKGACRPRITGFAVTHLDLHMRVGALEGAEKLGNLAAGERLQHANS
jgi:hypothetical protein